MTYEILGSGSSGNSVVLDGTVMIDCGVSFQKIRPFAKNLAIVLLTHEHSDHFKPSSVRALHQERPGLRWGCCEWMVPLLLGAGVEKRAIDVYELGASYRYSSRGWVIRAERLFHDVPNCGYHLVSPAGERIFYATDTGTMEGIQARDYDWYFLEANHTQAEIEARIEEKRASGEFAYEWKAARNHLSREQAEDWIYQNIGPKGRYVFLHQHVQRKERSGEDGQT